MTRLTDYQKSPKNDTAPKSLVVFLHGLGANGQDLIGLADQWANHMPDTLFLSPDAPQACDMAPPEVNNSYQWFSLQDRSNQAILKGVEDASHILTDYLDGLVQTYQITPDKIALVGFSQGTMLGLYTAMRRPVPIACIAGYSGYLPGIEEFGLSRLPTLFPVFLRHGEADDIVPVSAFHHAKDSLSTFGYEVTGDTVPHMGHGIDPDGIAQGGDFLARHLL